MAGLTEYDPVTRLFAVVATILLVVILIWVLIGTAQQPSLRQQMNDIEANQKLTHCLLLLEVADRSAALQACNLPE